MAESQSFDSVMAYSDVEAALIYGTCERVFAADPVHAHDPQPRPSVD